MILDGYCNGYLYYLWVVDGSYNYSWSCHAGKNHATNHLCLRMVFSIARIKMVMTGGAFMAVFCPHSCHIHGLSDLALRELENHGINIWMNCNDFAATLPYFIAFLRLRLALWIVCPLFFPIVRIIILPSNSWLSNVASAIVKQCPFSRKMVASKSTERTFSMLIYIVILMVYPIYPIYFV